MRLVFYFQKFSKKFSKATFFDESGGCFYGNFLQQLSFINQKVVNTFTLVLFFITFT
jgi:hypothetical protein